jgi:Tfp pilus assembly PilM family ATPase
VNSKKKEKRSAAEVVVEIGDDWLKAIQVSRVGSGVAATSIALVQLDRDRIVTADKIREALEKVGATRRPVYGCLSRQAATVRMLELPSTDPVEIADMVDLQVGKLTPYSKDEIVSDYRVIDNTRQGYTKVLLVIVQRSLLRSRFSLLAEAGVEVETMSVGTEGLLNWFRRAYPAGEYRGATAVIDIDSNFTELAVFAGDRLMFTRSIRIGAAALLSGESALRERFVRDVTNGLQTFSGEVAGSSVDRALLTGAGYNIDGLSDALADALDLPVETANCMSIFKKTPSDPPLQQEPYHAASLTALVGMAIAPDRLEYHLVPESVRLRRQLVQKAKSLTAFGSLMITALMLLSVLGTLKYFFKKENLASITRVVESSESEVHGIEKKRAIAEVVSSRSDQTHAIVRLIGEIQSKLPDPEVVVVDQLEFDLNRTSFQLTGSARSRPDIESLINSLEASSLLVNVQDLSRTPRDPQGRFKFSIECSLEVSDAT